MTYILFAFLIAAAYLIGSIPFGLVIARAHRVDLRSIGSGNIGATNVTRALGKKWGYLCFLLDVLKGLLPTLSAMVLTNTRSSSTHAETIISLFLWLAVGVAAIIGHIFPVYLKFRGGKGVATSFGVALGIWPYFTICASIAIVVWAAVLMIWRYVSLASLAASVAFPLVFIVAVGMQDDWELVNLWLLLIVSALIPLMVIIRHRENIKRLLAGTESKIQKKTNT